MEFSGVFVFGLEISKARDLTQFCGISRVRVLFSLKFPGVKYKNEKLYYREVFKKVYPQHPPLCLHFFWNSPMQNRLFQKKSKRGLQDMEFPGVSKK